MSKEHQPAGLAEAKMNPYLGAAASTSVSIGLQGVPYAGGAIVSYTTLPANAPKTYQNHIYVWQTSDNAVPWAKSPDGDTAVDTDSSQSTQPINFAFEQKGYIIGYAVAATPQATVATVYMPANKQTDPTAWQYSNLKLSVVYVGTNLVQVQYSGLPQYSPAANKNWIGLFQGSQVPYSGTPMKTVTVAQDLPDGYATITGVSLLIGVQYSVGYFMVDQSKGRTSLGAQAAFTIAQ